jgi:ABC-2 type transport system ATP-binding protein
MPTSTVAAPAATQSPTSAPPAIEAAGLVKRYPGKPPVVALDGLDLSVPGGTVFALLGPNGAGKSTTIKVLTTLSRPDAGQARVAGHDVLAEADRVRRAIGVVGQKPGFDPIATGRENLQLQGAIYDLRGAELRRSVDDALQRVGLEDAADRRARTYSGGMQRRLDIAMGLLHGPSVLFLDEPTTGLDPEARAALWEQIARLARDDRMTVLLTTHYLEEADALAAHVAIIDRGRVVASGTPDALKRDLHGDTLQVELETEVSPALIAEALAPLRVTVTGRVLRARTPDGAAALPRALAALADRDLAVSAATIARPSLDDVYLHHAGRSLREANEEESR